MSEGNASVALQQLLLSVGEELKLPLLQISRLAEQAEVDDQSNISDIRTSAQTALTLIDNYVLAVRLHLEATRMPVEAVSISSVLYDVGQQLNAMAKSYGVELELNVAGRFSTVKANHQALSAALTSLGVSLIEALPALETPQLKLQLATHRSRYGIVAGIYSDTKQLTNQALKRGRQLQGQSRQPLVNVTHTAGAGIFVADTILGAMNLSLTASRHHGLYGLGTVLQTNRQLNLV